VNCGTGRTGSQSGVTAFQTQNRVLPAATNVEPPAPTLPDHPALQPDDRLGSWKAIAAHLKRDVSTVQRWEKSEGMPVHRHLHAKRGSVYGSRSELDAWWASRSPRLDPSPGTDGPRETAERPVPAALNSRWATALAAVLICAVACRCLDTRKSGSRIGRSVERRQGTRCSPSSMAPSRQRHCRATASSQLFCRTATAPGTSGSRQIGTGEFHNLTQGRAEEILNDDLRSIGFSPDGSLVIFWQRTAAPPNGTPAINVWSVPTMGGTQRPYLAGGAEIAWSSDASRLVYHPPAAGDPFFIGDSVERPGRRIYQSPSGVHNHFPVWSPDDKYIYFVRGTPPEPTDIWRIGSDGSDPQRLTTHGSIVSHPTFIDRRTLLYLATAADGTGPWLHAFDVGRHVSRRIPTGVERYTSLAASADGHRLVLTTTRRKSSLWRASIPEGGEIVSEATPVAVRTTDGRSPRLRDGLLLFVASKGRQDTIWKVIDGVATELWSTTAGRVVGAPAISPEGRRIAFAVARNARAVLHVMTVGGVDAHPMSGGARRAWVSGLVAGRAFDRCIGTGAWRAEAVRRAARWRRAQAHRRQSRAGAELVAGRTLSGLLGGRGGAAIRGEGGDGRRAVPGLCRR
jgi:hypothetical protein